MEIYAQKIIYIYGKEGIYFFPFVEKEIETTGKQGPINWILITPQKKKSRAQHTKI